MAGKREAIATERPKKDPIVAFVADDVPRATVAAEAGMVHGRAVDANIVDPHTASNTTTDRPGRADRVNEMAVGCTSAGSWGLGKTGWMHTRSG